MTREEAIKVMNTIIAGVKHNIQLPMTVNDIEDACYMAIEALKEPKHGEWIEHHSGGVITFICSECKNIIDVDFEDFEKGEFKYCDMCGARMTHPKPH